MSGTSHNPADADDLVADDPVAAAIATGKADQRKIEDLLSGERERVRAAVVTLDEADLSWALGTEIGEVALAKAFELMPTYYLPGHFDEPVTVRWEVTRPPGEPIGRDVEFGMRDCRVATVDPGREPDLWVFLDGIGFVHAATGLVRGMELLMRGDLRVQGNVQVAMKMEAFFGLANEESPR